MHPKPNIERALYTLIILLSLIALWLTVVAPAYFTDNHVVYQGF
jgi:hypothetical protein